MSPQMEKVIPAGVKRFGKASDASPVVIPPIGKALAR